MNAELLSPPAARSREILALLDTLQSVPGNAVTACRGWTVHEIIAHLAAGCVALADQAEAFGAGDPVPPFGSWLERDETWRLVDDIRLRDELDRAEMRMTTALTALDERQPNQVIPDGGWGFTVTDLACHFRQEFALHRWDMIGDDTLGEEFLAQPEFAVHSVSHLSEWLLIRGLQEDPRPGADFDARIRGMAADDVALQVRGGVGVLEFTTPIDGGDVLHTDAAAGLLFIWGRRPADSRRTLSDMPVDHLIRMTSLLAGF
ncbi:MAG: maleylpyruvate isomerase N-terminal domain-containing protein [Nakamurella sp.]